MVEGGGEVGPAALHQWHTPSSDGNTRGRYRPASYIYLLGPAGLASYSYRRSGAAWDVDDPSKCIAKFQSHTMHGMLTIRPYALFKFKLGVRPYAWDVDDPSIDIESTNAIKLEV